MRVITGSAKGRPLKSVPGNSTRPTNSNVKEAVFSAIQFEIPDRNMLDLFAGTGQMGIECLSRGANHATFIDHDRIAISVIRENLKNCGLESRAEVYHGEYTSFLMKTHEKFDLIYLDPPFASDGMETALKLIKQFDILTPNGIIICESAVNTDISSISADFVLKREREYGRKKITILEREDSI